MQQIIKAIEAALAGEKPGLKAQLLMAPEFRKEELMNRNDRSKPRKSAVLLLLNPFDKELKLLFTKRSSSLKVHRGQVSFPGGQYDQNDISLQETALRETCEEIGVCKADIRVLGELSELFIPPSNFDVHCLVGMMKKPVIFNINTDEVEAVVEVPLSILLDKTNIKEKVFTTSTSGKQRPAPYFDVMGLEIWGATAMIVSELLELIRQNNIKI